MTVNTKVEIEASNTVRSLRRSMMSIVRMVVWARGRDVEISKSERTGSSAMVRDEFV